MNKNNRTLILGMMVAVSVHAEIAMELESGDWNDNAWSSKKITLLNNSTVPQYIAGMRFSCDYDVWSGDWTAPTTVLNSTSPYRVEAIFGNVEVNFSGKDTLTFEVTGTPGGNSAKPYDPSFLVQNGSHFWPMDIPYSEPVSVDEIRSLQESPDFYDESLGILDTLGQRGGPKNGGMIDTWYGLTQLQSALPTSPFNQNATWMTFEPQAYGNALYMMTLAAMQEYFNIDMQVLIAKGGKENMAGMVQWDSDGSGPTTKLNPIYGTGNNGLSNVDFSPFSVEYQTFNDYVFSSYPKFFPLGTTSPTGSASNDYYATSSGSGGYCALNKANVVNGTIIACLYNWFTYQIGLEATDYGFNELIAEGSDPQGALKLALWAFNRGITCGWEQTVASTDAFGYTAIEEYPGIADNGKTYIEGIVQALNPIIDAARNSENLGGTEPIYDDTISISLLEEFLFGTGGSGRSGTRGEGGLLVHFDLTDSEMISLWNDVEDAFALMKGKAPSTTATPEMISYRYDFLTVLRVVKQYLDTSIPLPTTYKFVSWVESKGSSSTTFGGEVRDEQYPRVMSTVESGGKELELTVSVSDNDSIASVEWSVDSDLLEWHREESVQGSDWLLKVNNLAPSADVIGTTFPYWVRVTDGWGNAEIISLEGTYEEFETSVVSTNVIDQPVVQMGMGRSLSVTMNTPGVVSLYSIRGQEVSQHYLSGSGTVDLSHLSKGIYLCRVQLSGGRVVVNSIILK